MNANGKPIEIETGHALARGFGPDVRAVMEVLRVMKPATGTPQDMSFVAPKLCAVRNAARELGVTVTMKRVEGGVRVWRVPGKPRLPKGSRYQLEVGAKMFDRFLKVVCQRFDVEAKTIIGRNRHECYVLARHALAALLVEASGTLSSIGRRLGGRDHNTIACSVKKAADAEETIPYFARTMALCREDLAEFLKPGKERSHEC